MLLSWVAGCAALLGECIFEIKIKITTCLSNSIILSAVGLRRAGIDVTLFEAAVRDIYSIQYILLKTFLTVKFW